MLAIHCKRTDNVEVKNPILAYVRETYGDRDADEALDDLVAIQNQRNGVVVAQSGSAGASKDSLIKYVGSTHASARLILCLQKLDRNQILPPSMRALRAHNIACWVHRYFKCLTAIETRFPISQEKGHARISFPWYDAFRPSKKTTQSNIHFEKAAVLFNIAAVLGQQALQVERGTSDGIKQVHGLQSHLASSTWCRH